MSRSFRSPVARSMRSAMEGMFPAYRVDVKNGLRGRDRGGGRGARRPALTAQRRPARAAHMRVASCEVQSPLQIAARGSANTLQSLYLTPLPGGP